MSVEREKHYDEVRAALQKATRKAVGLAATIIQAEVKKQLNKTGPGRPSPAGSPPAKQTGSLGRSIQLDTSRLNDKKPSARVGTNLVYARIQEFGGTIAGRPWLVFKVGDEFRKVRSVRLPARPYFRPGVKIARPKIKKAVRKVFNEALKPFAA